MADSSRDQDLRELYEARESANSTEDRERFSELMYKISNEDEETGEARQELVMATRNKDARHIRRVSEDLKIKQFKEGKKRNE